MFKVNTFFSVSVDGFEQVNICLGYNHNLVSVVLFCLVMPTVILASYFPIYVSPVFLDNRFQLPVFTSIHREGFICLGLKFSGTDQRCCVEDVSFLCQVPSVLL